MGFLINSTVHAWIRSNPDRLACQAEISASDHSCLNHDSYVDCLDLYEFSDWELRQARDEVSEQARQNIRAAVTKSKTIETKFKKLILDD